MSKAFGDLTDKTFGKLTVIQKADDIVSKSGKTKYPAWLCRCECGNEVVIKTATLIKDTHHVHSCGCSKEFNKNYLPKKMTSNELKYWELLYDYVNKKVMCYDKNMLSKTMILRLKGMREGKYLQHKEQDPEGIYPSEIILNTFKYCMPDITKVLSMKSFYTEEAKFNYICAIVEKNLNTVYTRMKNVEKTKQKIETMSMDIATHIGAEYQAKAQKTSEKLKDLW